MANDTRERNMATALKALTSCHRWLEGKGYKAELEFHKNGGGSVIVTHEGHTADISAGLIGELSYSTKPALLVSPGSWDYDNETRRYTKFEAVTYTKIGEVCEIFCLRSKHRAAAKVEKETGVDRLRATRQRVAERLKIDVEDIDKITSYGYGGDSRRPISVNVLTDEDVAHGHEEKFSLQLRTIGNLTEDRLIDLIEILRGYDVNTLPKELK